MEKYIFSTNYVELLAHVVSFDGARLYPEKVAAIRDAFVPHDQPSVSSSTGLGGYYLQCIQNFAEISASLQTLSSSKIKIFGL